MSRVIPKILIVDDEKNAREGLERALKFDYQVYLADSAESAIDILEDEKFDLVLTDVKMPGMDGISFVSKVKELNEQTVFVVMTAYGSISRAVDAMKAGAYDFITKPFEIDDLERCLESAIASKAKRPEIAKAAKAPASKLNIVGKSKQIKETIDLVKQIAPARSTVLLTGESGTGKELFAKAVHDLSDRKDEAFIAVHCRALNANLLESELFGHEKGAFTSANSRKIGRFEAADKGTLFLDEIGDIDAATQIKLLRVLESRTFERVGGVEPITVDVRLVAATNKDLRQMVKDGEFREDLYYRLDVLNVHLPPLRERKGDIPVLLEHFLKISCEENNRKIDGFTPEALKALEEYSWPGNIRELRNAVEKMTVLAKSDALDIQDIPKFILENPSPLAGGNSDSLDIGENEKDLIIKALKECNNNKTKAAEKLGISRRTLHRKIAQLGLE